MIDTEISINSINFSIGENKILEDINISIKKGEFTTLVGPNGAGKTTLLKIILKIVKPNSGYIKYFDSLKIGYVPQKISINDFFPVSVYDFLSIMSSKNFKKHTKILESLNINHLVKKPMNKLSGGEMQRVLLAQAIIREPSVLILDEPDQGLDINGQISLYETLLKIQEESNCAIFLVSHHLNFVFVKSHKVLCLNKHICCQGKPEDVKKHKNFVDLFPGFNGLLAPYNHKHDHTH